MAEFADKLAEYENTRLTPQEISNLKHELEVHKRALSFTRSERQIEELLEMARKELEDGK